MVRKIEQIKIFLSYAKQDESKIRRLYHKLKQSGFSPWMDQINILPGEDWKNIIIKSIREAHFFLACLTKNSINKRGVFQEEIKEALDVWRQKLDNDIFFIPVRFEECNIPASISNFQWVDLFKKSGFEKLKRTLNIGVERLGIRLILLRSSPIENLSWYEIQHSIKKYDFYCHPIFLPDGHIERFKELLHGDPLLKKQDLPEFIANRPHNLIGLGIEHNYEKKNDGKIVFDKTVGLMWQQSGLYELVGYDKALKYIEELNSIKFAGFTDWRVPTVEEAMSLMEPTAKNKAPNHVKFDLHIDPIFDNKIWTTWTCDKENELQPWAIYFSGALCAVAPHPYVPFHVRAVRSF